MFLIKAYAEVRSGKSGAQRNINKSLGIGRGNPQSRVYRRDGYSVMGGNSRTRGRAATITEVGRGR